MNQLILLCQGGGAVGVWILAPGPPPGSITHTQHKHCQG